MAIELASLEVPIRVVGDTTAAGALARVEAAGTQAADRLTTAMAGAERATVGVSDAVRLAARSATTLGTVIPDAELRAVSDEFDRLYGGTVRAAGGLDAAAVAAGAVEGASAEAAQMLRELAEAVARNKAELTAGVITQEQYAKGAADIQRELLVLARSGAPLSAAQLKQVNSLLVTTGQAATQSATATAAASARVSAALGQEVQALAGVHRAGALTTADTARLTALQRQLTATVRNGTLSLEQRALAARHLSTVNATLGVSTARTGATLGGFARSLRSVAAGFGLVLGAQGVIRLFRDTVTEATEAEKAWTRLRSAVEATGITYEAVSLEIQRATSRIQATTRFDDEAAAEALGTLTSITRDYTTSLAALPVVADIAVRTQTDLDTAAKLVGKALIGQTDALRRHGIVLRGDRDALEQLREQSRGYAEVDGRTLTGQLAIQRNQWNELKETMGRGVMPALVAVRGAALRLAEALAAPSPLMVGIAAAIGTVGVLTAAVWALNVALAAAAAGGFAAFVAGLAALATNPVGLAIIGIGAAIGGVTALVLQAKRETAEYAARLRELAAAGSHAREKLSELAQMGRHDRPTPPLTDEELEALRKAQAAFDAETDALLTLAAAGKLTEAEFKRFTDRQARVAAIVAGGNLPLERRIALLRQLAEFEELTRGTEERVTPELPERVPPALPGAANAGAPNVVQTDPTGLDELATGVENVNDRLDAQRQRTADILATLRDTIAFGIAGAVAAAATGGSIGEAIATALGQGLQQLGMAAIEYGVTAIALGELVAKIQAAIFSNPALAIVAGAALVAIGAALAKAGQRSTKIAQGGGGGGSARGLTDMTTDITVNPRAPGTSPAVATASALRPAQPIQYGPIFAVSPNSPEWQRLITTTQTAGARRGLA